MANGINRLSDKQCATAKPRAQPYTLADGGSLYLRVKPTQDGGASKAWQFYFKWQDKTERLSLGVYPDVSLVEARKRRDAAKAELASDPPRHPGHEKRARKQEALAAKTVRQAFDDWHESYLAKNRRDGGAEAKQTFERDVFPVIGDLPAGNIKPAHITRVISRPLGRGARRRANMTLALLKQFFAQAAVRGFVEASPVAHFTKQHAGGIEKARERALSVEEIRELARKLPECGLAAPQQAAIRLLLATGVRLGELHKAQWREIDFDAALWRIPAANTKELRPHTVHLSAFALAQLHTLLEYRVRTDDDNDGQDAPLLSSVKNKQIRPIADAKSLSKSVADRQTARPHKSRTLKNKDGLVLTGGRWTLHDLRRSMATRMGDLAIAPHVVEKCLSHRMPGVMAVYNRQEYLPERKAAFEAWGEQLARLFSPQSNVVELSKRRANVAP